MGLSSLSGCGDGAEVIKIETRMRPEYSQTIGPSGQQGSVAPNRVGYFAANNYSKKSITLNMKQSKAAELVKDLIKRSDIVTENFGGEVMERWGLGYSELEKIRPGIIVYAGSGFGRTGPYRKALPFASIIDAFSGFAFTNGYPSGQPAEAGGRGWTDSVAAQYGCLLFWQPYTAAQRQGGAIY